MIPAIEERYASIEQTVGVKTLQQVYDVLAARGLGHLKPKAAPRHRPGLLWKGRAAAQQLALL